MCVRERELKIQKEKTTAIVSMSLVTTRVAVVTNAIWPTVFSGYYRRSTNLSPGQFLSLSWSYLICCVTDSVDMWASSTLPTLVAPPVFDDYGPSAARLLFSLGHALTSLIVRVIRSVDCHLLLNHPETWQLVCGTEETREDRFFLVRNPSTYFLLLVFLAYV